MSVSFRDSVSILQIAAYVPAFLGALLLCARHGFAKSSGWYFLASFGALRIISSASQLIDSSSPSKEAKTAFIITSSIGLSPLTLLTLGLLARVNDQTTPQIKPLIFKLISLMSFVGLILGITGGVKQSQSSTPLAIGTISQVAVVNFTLVFVTVVVILGLLAMRIATVPQGEKRLLLAASVSVPFLTVRIVYALISDFANNPDFGVLNGNTTIYLCMGVLMEMFVVIISLVVGFTLRVVPANDKKEILPTKASNSRLDEKHFTSKSHACLAPGGQQISQHNLYPPPQWPSTSREPLTPMTPLTPRRRGGPITALVRAGKDYYNKSHDTEKQ